MRLSFAASLLAIALIAAFTACANSSGGPDDPNVRYAPRQSDNCQVQDVAPWNMTIYTCVVDTGPNTLPGRDFGPNIIPEEAELQWPYVITVVDTPAGQWSNPLVWSLEVERDGEVLIERPFDDDEVEVQTQENGDRVRIRSALPLTEQEALEPGTYEVRYRVREQGEVGANTIEIADEADVTESSPDEER